jgi:hypothetical protein
MLRRGGLAGPLFVLLSLGACANLLGDFTKGDEATLGDSGSPSSNDAAPPDSASPGTDAAPPPLLTCQFQTGSQVRVATLTLPEQDVPDDVFFLGPTARSRTGYVVVPGGGSGTQSGRVFKYASDQTSPSVTEIPVPGSRIYGARRTQDGIVVLAIDRNIPAEPGHSQLVILKLSETLTDGGIPVWQRFQIGPTDAVPPNTCRESATFAVLDNDRNDYFAAIGFNAGPSDCSTADPPKLWAARAGTAVDGGTIASFVEWPVPDTIRFLELQRDGIVIDTSTAKVYVFADPGGGAPTPGVGPVVFSASDTSARASSAPLPLGADVGFAGGFGYRTSSTAGRANAAFLGGDIALSAPTFFVGNVPANELATTPIGTGYRKTAINGIEPLPVDKGRAHWLGDHLLAIGRNDLKGGTGVNVYWFDQAGFLRAQQAASDAGTHSALLQGHEVIGNDISFGSEPIGSPAAFGELLIVVTELVGTDAGTKSYSLTQYRLNCSPP